jgi:hypothetical protein
LNFILKLIFLIHREERDFDELYEADQRLIVVNASKQSTLENIKRHKKIGKDTRELESKLLELMVIIFI